jgi:hypothetical protein
VRLPQVSFGAGELSESLWDRTDFSKIPIGARRLENCVVRQAGGFTNRPGTIFLGESVGDGVLFPFKYSATQEYVLLFTDYAMRVIKDNGLVLRSIRNASYSWTLSGSGTNEYYLRTAANGNPNLPVVGDSEFFISGAVATKGTPGSLAAGRWGYGDVSGLGYNTFYVRLASGVDPDTLALDAIQIVSVTTTPYPLSALDEVSITQSFDTVFLSRRGYTSQRLTRTSHADWTFNAMTFVPGINPPSGLTASPGTAATLNYDYFISSVDEDRSSNPAMSFADVDEYNPYQAADTTAINAEKVTVSCVDPWAGEVHVSGLDTGAPYYALWRKRSADTAWTLLQIQSTPVFIDRNDRSGGAITLDTRATIAMPTGQAAAFSAATSTTADLTYKVSAEADDESYPSAAVSSSKKLPWDAGTSVGLTWGAVNGAVLYNLYKNSRGQWGWIGSVKATDVRSYKDDNIEPDVSYGPRTAPVYDLGVNTPACVAIFQQRLCFSGMDADPSRLITSRIGSFLDFSVSDPLRADDPVDARPASGRGDPIVHMVPFDSLIIFTSDAVWLLNGDNGNLKSNNPDFKVQSYEGAARTPAPLVIGNTVLFVQLSGKVVLDLAYAFSSDKYEGNDLTVFADHLFRDSTIRRWAYEAKPASRVWTIMTDGSFRCLTYQRDQDLRAWCRQTTDGVMRSVASINAGTYFLVKRTINSVDRYYLERLATDAEAIFTDCSLSYSGGATTTISGLSHLEGKTVTYRGIGPSSYDGYGTAVVTAGAITLPSAVTSATIGLTVTANFHSLDINKPGDDGERRLSPAVLLRLRNTRGITVGSTGDRNLYAPAFSDGFDEGYDQATKKFSGDISIPIDTAWSRNPTIYIRQSAPYLMHVVALIPEQVGNERE